MKKTKIFLDTEFTGLHQNTSLISIGLISECGKTFYAELTDYDKNQIDDWLRENVIKNLKFNDKSGMDTFWNNGNDTELYGGKEFTRDMLSAWLSQFGEVEMWSDCLAYDWVLFNELYGHAFNIPKHVYYIPFDLCTLLKIKDIDPDISREALACVHDMKMPNGEFPEKLEDIPKHNALWDARIIRECYKNVINS